MKICMKLEEPAYRTSWAEFVSHEMKLGAQGEQF